MSLHVDKGRINVLLQQESSDREGNRKQELVSCVYSNIGFINGFITRENMYLFFD